jgi:GH24 family phage-related lysozyme (muramidase)
MPKIPTFTAKGSIEQLAGTTSNIQMGLNNTLASVLAPVTEMVVNEKIKQNDTQNRTEALRLGNEFTRDLQDIEDTIANDNTGLGVNKQSANAYYKEKTNNLIDKFKSQSSNNATATLFTNNALSAVNRGIFRIDTIVDKNVFKDLGNQVEQAEKSLITQALFNNKDANIVDEFGMLGNVNDFDYASLQTNLTKLYTDAYSGKIPAANLDAIINDIPSVVQGFQANKDIYDNPSFAYTELNKGENSSVYPDLKVEQRTKLINKVETMMAQPMQKEFANVIFSLQGKGTEQPFDFDFAKKILPPEEYNELITTYNLAKINAADVRLIRTLSLSEADEFIESKNFGTPLYEGSADLITQDKLKQSLIKVRDDTEKQMLEDPVKLQIDSNPEITELFNDYVNETDNPEIKISNLKIFTNAIIEDQKKRGIERANLKILTKEEVTNIKNNFLDTTITAEDKLKLKEQLIVMYGDEKMGMILNHLQDEKTSDTILMAIATDSPELAKDLFNSSTLKQLSDRANQKEAGQVASLQKLIAKETEDFGQVIDSQGEGSESKAAKMLRINEALLKVALVRMNKNVSADDAVESAANDFLNDYVLNDDLTALIPKIINKIPVPVVAAQNKAEAILIGIKDKSEGNYLDRFMGEKGYMHYASSLNITNLSEEEVKKQVAFTIRNYSKWLNNSDMTGMVLYSDFSNGLQPVTNSDGQRVEFYFTNLPNQDPTIKDTSSVYPVTGDVLPIIPDPFPADYMNPYDDYFKYNESLIDETIDEGKKNSKFPVTDFSIISKANAGEATLGDNFLADNNNIKMLSNFESTELKPYNLKYIVNGKEVIEDFRTVGKGHRITEAEEKSGKIHTFNIDTLTEEQVDIIFKKDLEIAIKDVDKLVTNKNINPTAYSILVQMGFQLGATGLGKFKKTIKAINKLEYELASKHMLNNYEGEDYKNISKEIGKTKWHDQTPKRAKKLSKLMASLEKKPQLINESP